MNNLAALRSLNFEMVKYIILLYLSDRTREDISHNLETGKALIEYSSDPPGYATA